MRPHLPVVATCVIASVTVALVFAELDRSATVVIDPASASRGSLGAPLEELSLSDNLGKLSFFLNGGFALMFGAFASLAATKRHRDPIDLHRERGGDRSGESAHST
jgi:hypothetical protein